MSGYNAGIGPTIGVVYRLDDKVMSVRDVRRHETEQGVYIIRDLQDEGERFTGCEYAVKAEGGGEIWKPCAEGVLFSEIEPYEARV